MDLTIIIVNWNTKELLSDCLSSIKEHSYDQKVKVIVVDNSSKDGSRDMVRTLFPEVHLINSGGNIGFARANNLAIPHSDTSLVMFLNPDTIVPQGTIKKMITFMEGHPSVGVLGCKMIDSDGSIHDLGLQWFPSPITEFINTLFLSSNTLTHLMKMYLPYKDPDKSDYVKKLYGGCLMIRKLVLEEIGYFDERFFMYAEDVDLCNRIYKGGWKLYYLSSAEIIHLAGGASGRASENFGILMKCESLGKLMQKYYGKKGEILYKLGIFVGSQGRLLILSALRIITPFSLTNNNINFKYSFSKYVAMIKWSLNLQKPIIKE